MNSMPRVIPASQFMKICCERDYDVGLITKTHFNSRTCNCMSSAGIMYLFQMSYTGHDSIIVKPVQCVEQNLHRKFKKKNGPIFGDLMDYVQSTEFQLYLNWACMCVYGLNLNGIAISLVCSWSILFEFITKTGIGCWKIPITDGSTRDHLHPIIFQLHFFVGGQLEDKFFVYL